MSRTKTFGEKGVSRAQFFHQYLGNIHLNTVAVPWTQLDLQYLSKQQWDADLTKVVRSARVGTSVAELQAATCPEVYAGALQSLAALPREHNWLPAEVMADERRIMKQAIVLRYASNQQYEGFARVSDCSDRCIGLAS